MFKDMFDIDIRIRYWSSQKLQKLLKIKFILHLNILLHSSVKLVAHITF